VEVMVDGPKDLVAILSDQQQANTERCYGVGEVPDRDPGKPTINRLRSRGVRSC